MGTQVIADAETFANAVRSHWAIEKSLHWVLDVTFREDDCRVRKGHAPQNFSALRKLALFFPAYRPGLPQAQHALLSQNRRP